MFEWILGVIESGGYVGLFFLMVLENLFPPIPSEFIVPLAGFLAAEGTFSLWIVIVVGTLGSLGGATAWYLVGRMLGFERVKRLIVRYERITTFTDEDMDKAQQWFTKYGAAAVFFGRFIPGVRTFISVPAGIARMPVVPFLIYSGLGSAPWVILLAVLGYMLQSEYERVGEYLDPLSIGVLVFIVLWYLFRVVTYKAR